MKARRGLAQVGVLAIVLAAATAIVLVAEARAGGPPRARSGTQMGRVLGALTASTGQATKSTVPAYLPSGASVASTTSQPVPSAAESSASSPDPPALVGPRTTTMILLSGAANANNVTNQALASQVASPPPQGDGAAVHPATTVTSVFIPDVTAAPSLRDTSDFSETPVEVGGNSGDVIEPVGADSGTYEVEWADADGYHALQEDRLDTVNGLSGVSPEALTSMAQSLYDN